MTNDEMVKKYLDSIHGTRINYNNSVLTIMPFIIMDIWYQKFGERIGTMKCKFDLVDRRKKWLAAYHKFNDKFFEAYTKDEWEYVTDKMDSLEKHIHNELVFTRLAFRKCAAGLPDDALEIVTDFQMCDVINSMAQKVWEYEFGFPNPMLDKIQTLGWRWMDKYFKWSIEISMNGDESEMAVNKLCHESLEWVKMDKES